MRAIASAVQYVLAVVLLPAYFGWLVGSIASALGGPLVFGLAVVASALFGWECGKQAARGGQL